MVGVKGVLWGFCGGNRGCGKEVFVIVGIGSGNCGVLWRGLDMGFLGYVYLYLIWIGKIEKMEISRKVFRSYLEIIL